MAHCLSRDSFILNQNHGSAVTAELLGLKNDREVRELVSDLGTNIDARAQVITLAIVLERWRRAPTRAHGATHAQV